MNLKLILIVLLIISLPVLAATPTPTPIPTPTTTTISIKGSVDYAGGGDTSGVAIKILQNGLVLNETATGPDGTFQFPDTALTPGTYYITAEKGLYFASVYVGLDYGLTDIGVMPLERGRL